MATVRTMCPMNCHPTYCGMQVELQEGKVTKISGDPENPDSQGFLCVRGRAAHEMIENPKRLLQPLRRVGPRGSASWEPISWQEALAQIVASIQASERKRSGIWFGHGASATGTARPLLMRFGSLAGVQIWNPAMTCWSLGAYGLALVGLLETNTKEDMAAHSQSIILWGANLASQPTTAPHLVAARKRGAHVTLIDVRRTEAARHADEVVLIRPGTDAALALAMCHVIVAEHLAQSAFLAEHSIGYEQFSTHVAQFTPEWAAAICGIAPETIRQLARRYATARPAMIVLGGSSIFKHERGWQAGRAIACLPAITGQIGIAGGGFGPRHRGFTRGDGLASLEAYERKPADMIPNHMPSVAAALEGGELDNLLIFGSNMLSSFANAGAIERGLSRTRLVVVHDLFMNETSRRYADIVLPGTIWLEQLGIKDTATHIYLMEQALESAGEARSIINVLRDLAGQLAIEDYFPWPDEEAYLNAWLAPQRDEAGNALTIAKLRAQGGMAERGHLSHIAYPDLRFHTPSGKLELYSERAEQVGIGGLPDYTPTSFDAQESGPFALQLGQGRTLTAFHSFYDEGQALPSLAKLNPAPELWINPLDAQARGIGNGAQAMLYNEGGELAVVAKVTSDAQAGVVWLRDGHYGLNHLTSGAAALDPQASDLISPTVIPGGQSAYHARVEVRRITEARNATEAAK
jgi:anaerobic selenocysteine-containing dehydrogenase